MEFIQVATRLSASSIREHRNDDTWIDRLCHRYSVILYSIFAVLITSKTYIGAPIDCWAPAEFKFSYERYAETLCYVNGTYHISVNDSSVPIESKERYLNKIRYYQWTPFILLLQALLMYLPRFIWITFNSRYGINLKNLVDAAKKYETLEGSYNRERILIYMCKNLLRSIEYKNYRTNGPSRFQSDKLHANNSHYQMKLTTPLTINENQMNRKNQLKIRLPKQGNHLFTAYLSSEYSQFLVQTNKYQKPFLKIFETSKSVEKNPEAFTSYLNEVNCKDKTKDFSLISYLKNSFLSYLYILVKLSYMLSLISQVSILNRLMDHNFTKLGINLMQSFLNDSHSPQLAIFPRISLCEIYIREIATIHPYLIQCVLTINRFNELIFILVWFWLLFIISLTGIDLIARFLYTVISCPSCQHKLFALQHLQLIHSNETKSTQVNQILIETCASPRSLNNKRYILVKANRSEQLDLFEKFCSSNLTSDCVFALRIIQQNTSSLIVSELIEYLWRQFKLLNYVYSNETNDFYLKRVISNTSANRKHIQSHPIKKRISKKNQKKRKQDADCK